VEILKILTDIATDHTSLNNFKFFCKKKIISAIFEEMKFFTNTRAWWSE